MTNDNVAAVLALVNGSQEPDSNVLEAETPVPPAGTSPKGSALWYALVEAYEFHIGEMAILEQLVTVQTHLDEIEADWRKDGSPTQATGSMGQSVTDPRIQELRMLRQQYAALVKALNIPADGGQEKRRPGRPTRLNSNPGSRWGIR